MKAMSVLGLLISLFGYHLSVHVKTYHDYKVIKAFPKTKQHREFLQEMETRSQFDFWTRVTENDPVDIMVSPQHITRLKSQLEKKGIAFKVSKHDVQSMIENERVATDNVSRALLSTEHRMDWTEYHSLEDMYTYLDYLEKKYDFVSTEIIGKSYEGRIMRVAKVCRGTCGSKKAVWLDGCIHAREWIACATVTWMLMELVEHDSDHPELTQNLDWYDLNFVIKTNINSNYSQEPSF